MIRALTAGRATIRFPGLGEIDVTNLARTMLLLPFLLRAAGAAPDPPSYEAAALGTVLETAQGRLRLVARDILISNPGTYGIPDEQLHYPWLYESTNGIWYLTYREGPHHEAQKSISTKLPR